MKKEEKMKTYSKKEIREMMSNTEIEKQFSNSLSKYNKFYVFKDVEFNYLHSVDKELNGLYACIIEVDGERYFSPTDGISYDLFCDNVYIENNNILIIPEIEFGKHFQFLEEFDEEDFIKNSEIEVNFDEETIILYNFEKEAQFDFQLEALDDLATFLIEEGWGGNISKKVQHHILNNFDVKYDANEFLTLSHSRGVLKLCNKEYEVNLDLTGNCNFGGFYFYKGNTEK